MNKTKFKNNHSGFDHLRRNLERISSDNSIFNYNSRRKAFLSPRKEDFREWLDTLLPNTRLILEPKIIGSSIIIQYDEGKIKKAINKNIEDMTEKIFTLRNIPKRIPLTKRIEIQGVIYDVENSSLKNDINKNWRIKHLSQKLENLRFCAYQIFHCKINHFQSLQELKNLNFEIPQTEFTNYISDIEIYHKCWKEGKLFNKYPSNGIVLKINSRKFQKYLGDNNISLNWAYTIK